MDYTALNYDQVRKSQTHLREWLATHICDYFLLARGDDFQLPLGGYTRNGILLSTDERSHTDSRLHHKIVDIPYDQLMAKDFTRIDLGHSIDDEDWNGYFHFGRIELPYKEFVDAGMQVGDFMMIHEVQTATYQSLLVRRQVTQELHDLYNGIRLTYAITTHTEE